MSPKTTHILDDVAKETAAVGETAKDGSATAVEDTVLLIEFANARFAAMGRAEAGDKGCWLASYLVNKLRLEPEGLDSLAEYMMQAGLELRRRSLEARTIALREATEEWRKAGCPGRAPVVDARGTTTRRDGEKAEKAQAALAALLG